VCSGLQSHGRAARDSVPTLAWLIPLGSLIAPSVVSFSLQRFTSLLRPVSVTLATAGWCLLFVCESPSVAAVQISSLVILVASDCQISIFVYEFLPCDFSAGQIRFLGPRLLSLVGRCQKNSACSCPHLTARK
jgi:hypothetical protein